MKLPPEYAAINVSPLSARRLRKVGRVVVQQIAVEKLHPLVARRRDIGEGTVHVGEGAIGQLGN